MTRDAFTESSCLHPAGFQRSTTLVYFTAMLGNGGKEKKTERETDMYLQM